jgi:hypothetical protein
MEPIAIDAGLRRLMIADCADRRQARGGMVPPFLSVADMAAVRVKSSAWTLASCICPSCQGGGTFAPRCLGEQ